MEKQSFLIPNISCGHCVNAVKSELMDHTGVHAVSGDPTTKTITVVWGTPASTETIRKALEEINYPAK